MSYTENQNKYQQFENELVKWMQLARAENIGSTTFYSLLRVYKTPQKALDNIHDIETRIGKKILVPSEDLVAKEIELVNKLGGKILISSQDEYPHALCNIKDAPPLITVLGNKELLKKQAIAMVGARSATINSCIFTRKVATELAKAGFNIVSGLALGIDSAAHSIVDLNFHTTAVIATGIDIIYPKENKELYKKIAQNGLIITEVPLGKAARPFHFTRRNRIISGLSECALVMEAGAKSGSLVTAKYAFSQGKKVFAVPGWPVDERFAGCNFILKNGAILFESAEDVINALKKKDKVSLPSKEKPKTLPQNPNNNKDCHKHYANSEIYEVKKEILKKIDYFPVDVEAVVQHLKTSINLVLMAIIELEIEGRITRSSNKVSLLCR